MDEEVSNGNGAESGPPVGDKAARAGMDAQLAALANRPLGQVIHTRRPVLLRPPVAVTLVAVMIGASLFFVLGGKSSSQGASTIPITAGTGVATTLPNHHHHKGGGGATTTTTTPVTTTTTQAHNNNTTTTTTTTTTPTTTSGGGGGPTTTQPHSTTTTTRPNSTTTTTRPPPTTTTPLPPTTTTCVIARGC